MFEVIADRDAASAWSHRARAGIPGFSVEASANKSFCCCSGSSVHGRARVRSRKLLERAQCLQETALVVSFRNRQQLIDEGSGVRRGRAGDDALGEEPNGLELMLVEKFRDVVGCGRL